MRYRFILLLLLLVFLPVSGTAAEIYETFLEPTQVVDMASNNRERLTSLHVKEGDHVKTGQLLAEFDSKILQARLQLAKTAVSFHGNIDAARALVRQRKTKLTVIEKLNKSGNARPQELDSAQTNLLMAESQLLSAREGQKIKEAELAVITAQFEEKKLHSPFDGVIVKIYKQEAELVGGNEQHPIMTLVQLDPLLAVFHIPQALLPTLTTGQSVLLSVNDEDVQAEVEFVSPVIDAQSGTVTIRFRLPNQDNKYVSGSRVTFIPSPVEGVSQ